MIYRISDIARALMDMNSHKTSKAKSVTSTPLASAKCTLDAELRKMQTETIYFNAFERRMVQARGVTNRGKVLARKEYEWGM